MEHPSSAQRDQETNILHEIAAAVSREQDFLPIFKTFTSHLGSLIHFDAASLIVMREEGGPHMEWTTLRQDDRWDITEKEHPRRTGPLTPGEAKSASYHVLTTGQPVIRGDWDVPGQYQLNAEAKARGTRSDILFPLLFRGQVIAVLSLASRRPSTYSKADIPLLGRLADRLGPALYNTRLLANLERRNQEIHTLNQMAKAVNGERDFQRIFEVFTGQLDMLMPFDVASLFIFGEDGKPYCRWLTRRKDSGLVTRQADFPLEYDAHVNHPTFKRRAMYHVLEHGDPMIRGDWHQPGPFALSPVSLQAGIRSDILMPLHYHSRVIGVLALASKQTYTYAEADLPLLRQLSEHLAPAVHNTRLLLEVEEQNRQLEANRTQLEAQNAELERFAYTASHDLKSPLVTIKGFLGLVRQDLEDGDMQRLDADLEHISKAAGHMGRLLDDLLALSRVGRQANTPVDIDMAELAHEAVTLVKGPIDAAGVQVSVAAGLPTVLGDRQRLLEVWQNLIDNAVKFIGDAADPHINIGHRQDGEETVFYVRDNGIGIEPHYSLQIFELFNRLSEDIDGTGIGLALVKRIVEVHGGRVWAESEGKGKGSTFCFTLDPKVWADA